MDEIDQQWNNLFDQEETKQKVIKYQPIKVADLVVKPLKEKPWVVEGMIPEGTITCFSGPTGCGKSLIVFKIADLISRGEDIFGKYKSVESKVLWFDFEMTEFDVAVRAKEICAKNSEMFLQYDKVWKIEDQNSIKFLEDFIKNNGIKVIVFDTLSKIHRADENSNTQMTPIMEKMLELCRGLNVSIILIHHNNKNQEALGLGKGRGASAIPDNCASYFMVESKKMSFQDKDVLEIQLKQEKARRRENINHIAVNVIYDELAEKTNFDFVGEINEERDRLDNAKKGVMDYLIENPDSNKSIIHSALDKSFSRRAVDGALDVMTEEGIIVKEQQWRSIVYRVKNYEKIVDSH